MLVISALFVAFVGIGLFVRDFSIKVRVLLFFIVAAMAVYVTFK